MIIGASALGGCGVQTSLFFDSILRPICDNILAIGLMGQVISDTITNRDEAETKQSENRRRWQ